MKNVRIVKAGLEHSALLAGLHDAGFSKSWTRDEFAALLNQPGVAAWIYESGEPPALSLCARQRTKRRGSHHYDCPALATAQPWREFTRNSVRSTTYSRCLSVVPRSIRRQCGGNKPLPKIGLHSARDAPRLLWRLRYERCSQCHGHGTSVLDKFAV